ncbi:MAG: nucleotidyltransferase family protein [Acidobacteriaceae bacterium]|nr:nucleotidyltransferase family protein [Acidobacteriaceae bacterium]
MSSIEMVKEKRREILRIAEQYGASNVRIFGSVARGQDDERSDIDFLVELQPGRTLFDLGGLQMNLVKMFGRPVDVVMEKGIDARIRDTILKEAIPV